MKKLVLNLITISIITLGFAAAIYHVQAQGSLSDELSQGHAHSSSETGETHGQTSEGVFCSEHNLPTIECGICQPQLAEALKPGESMKVRLLSMDAVAKAGIVTATPVPNLIQTEQSLLCTVSFNQNRMASISSLAEGVIQKVFVNIGDEVKEGQILAEIASSEIAKAKSEYIKATNQEELKRGVYQREKELVEKNISARQDFHQADVDFRMAGTETKAARQHLLNLGLSSKEIAALDQQSSSSSILKVAAPFSGVLIEKHAVMGEAVKAGDSILEIADLSTMWLQISIPESQVGQVQKGDDVTAVFEILPGLKTQGKITWVSPRIHLETRLVQVLAEVENSEGQLKEGMFGAAFLSESVTERNLAVPTEAVQEVDGKPFVFIKQGDDLYDLRRVSLGKKTKTQTEILAGIQSQDAVVTINSFVLKSEFLKSRFGAGCAHD